MANPHFGNIGDVWKHLALAALLAGERPLKYWESHSGAARYILSTTPQRTYGIFYFLQNVDRSQVLRSSAYNNTLEDLEDMNGSVPTYPGSPLLALMLLRTTAEAFVFCDVDEESLASIGECAAWVGVNERRVRCICGDGVGVLLEEIEATPEGDLLDTLVFIDPFDPLEGLEVEASPMDLFCTATSAGAKTVLWYGFRSGEERTRCWDAMLRTIRAYEIDSSGAVLWCGEICLRDMDDPDFTFDPGVRGCGLLTANLGDEARKRCSDLGKELSRLYERATVPTGHSGAFDFNTVSMW